MRWISNRVTVTIQCSLYDPVMSCDSRLNGGAVGSKTQSLTMKEYYIKISGDKIEKNEMGWACSAYGEGERRIQGFGGET